MDGEIGPSGYIAEKYYVPVSQIANESFACVVHVYVRFRFCDQASRGGRRPMHLVAGAPMVREHGAQSSQMVLSWTGARSLAQEGYHPREEARAE
ncbi:MAG: hypothetical protein C4345_10100 [Chloroflexota bacterium]